jgi:transcriptional regulator with XRE-family HTH domain
MSSDIVKRLGERIKELRMERGWSQFEFSERVGIDRSYLSEIETGTIEVCLRNLAAIAQGLDLEPWQLLKLDYVKRK